MMSEIVNEVPNQSTQTLIHLYLSKSYLVLIIKMSLKSRTFIFNLTAFANYLVTSISQSKAKSDRICRIHRKKSKLYWYINDIIY